MANAIKLAAGMTCLLTILFIVIYRLTDADILLTFAITFGTIAYHFCMRLLVGLVINAVMKNRADYTKPRFRVGKAEAALYKRLGVKSWKAYMPTYDNSFFDLKLHSADEVAQAMCQAEIVHETIIVLSFLPIVASIWFGALPVFVITSVISATLDGVFVIIQRYNRPRIIRLVNRQSARDREVTAHHG